MLILRGSRRDFCLDAGLRTSSSARVSQEKFQVDEGNSSNNGMFLQSSTLIKKILIDKELRCRSEAMAIGPASHVHEERERDEVVKIIKYSFFGAAHVIATGRRFHRAVGWLRILKLGRPGKSSFS